MKRFSLLGHLAVKAAFHRHFDSNLQAIEALYQQISSDVIPMITELGLDSAQPPLRKLRSSPTRSLRCSQNASKWSVDTRDNVKHTSRHLIEPTTISHLVHWRTNMPLLLFSTYRLLWYPSRTFPSFDPLNQLCSITGMCSPLFVRYDISFWL